jgi:hypothetical protein
VLFYFHYLIKPEMTDISESVSLAQSEPHWVLPSLRQPKKWGWEQVRMSSVKKNLSV